VKVAIVLLVLVISFATFSLFSNLIFSDFYTFKEKVPNYLISFALFAFLAFHINARRNWARILYIVLLAIAMIVIPSNIIRLLSVNKLSALILFIQTLLQVAAAVALLTKSANKWFRAGI
jgi:hypothetical protein